MNPRLFAVFSLALLIYGVVGCWNKNGGQDGEQNKPNQNLEHPKQTFGTEKPHKPEKPQKPVSTQDVNDEPTDGEGISCQYVPKASSRGNGGKGQRTHKIRCMNKKSDEENSEPDQPVKVAARNPEPPPSSVSPPSKKPLGNKRPQKENESKGGEPSTSKGESSKQPTKPETTLQKPSASSSPSVCGQQKSQYNPKLPNRHRIVNGQEAVPHSWPWQAHLEMKSRGSDAGSDTGSDTSDGTSERFNCGATLLLGKPGATLASDVAVTAAHCVLGGRTGRNADNTFVLLNNIEVLFGVHDTTNLAEEGRFKARSRVVVPHEDYNGTSHLNDIALIFLNRPVQFKDTIIPLCLPNDHQDSAEGKTCVTTGWGKTLTQHDSNTLQQLNTPVLSKDQCEAVWNELFMRDGMVCAGDNATHVTPSEGDSGGPLQCYDKKFDVWKLYGVSSFVTNETELGLGKPAVYTDVAFHLGWIRNGILQHSLV